MIRSLIMAKNSTKSKQLAASTPAPAPVAPEGNDVESEYNNKIEKCGLNMPMLLQEILHELMLLRASI